jgi:hypothetical protein
MTAQGFSLLVAASVSEWMRHNLPHRSLTPLLTRALALLGLGAGLEAAEPVPDFSAYEKKTPWVIPVDAIAARAKNQPHSNFVEARVPAWQFPALLADAQGKTITTPAAWSARRAELLELFRHEVFGVSPPRPPDLSFRLVETDPRAMAGAATLKRIAVSFALGGEPFVFHVTLFVTNRRTAPTPVFLLLNHRSPENTDPARKTPTDFWPAEYVIARGCAIAAINVAAEVDPDNALATQTQGVRAFYRKYHPQAADFTWATLAAWAWSGSRAVDYIATDPDLDATRIAVIGHSRTGKAALWSAAQDERFALACVNGAGEGGPAPARRDFGETLAQITRNFPHWFTPRYATYAARIAELPVDSHQLIALVAPRAYHGGDGELDLWADPRGAWLALVEASRVWALLGGRPPLHDTMPLLNDLLLRGPLAYHMHTGGHALTAFDWKLYLDHADTLGWRAKP